MAALCWFRDLRGALCMRLGRSDLSWWTIHHGAMNICRYEANRAWMLSHAACILPMLFRVGASTAGEKFHFQRYPLGYEGRYWGGAP